MQAARSILLALLLSVATGTPAQEAPKSIEGSGFVVGVDTYFDFGPPFHYFEIFIETPAKEGTKVEKFTLTPPLPTSVTRRKKRNTSRRPRHFR